MSEARSTDTTVRPAIPADLDRILAIEMRAFEPARRSTPRALKRAFASPRQCLWVCESGGRVAGFAIAWRFARTWRLYNLATDPAAHGRGIGSRLLTAVIDAARVAGAGRVVLESRDDPQLSDWYRARGFHTTRVLSDYYGSGQPALRMELALTATG